MLVTVKINLDIQYFYIEDKRGNFKRRLFTSQLHTLMSHDQPMEKLKQSQIDFNDINVLTYYTE